MNIEITPLHDALAEWQRKYLLSVLQAAGNNITEAARLAGKSRKHIYRLIRQSGLHRSHNPPGRKVTDGNEAWRALG